MLGLDKRKTTSVKWGAAGLLTLSLLLSACGNADEPAGNGAGAGEASPAATAAASPAASAAAAASPAAEQPAEKTVTDAMGHEVTVPASPKRILASYLEDHLVTLGVTPVAQWSVANGIQDYLGEHLKDVPTVGYDLPTEAVLSHQPDFIIVGSEGTVQNGHYDQLNKIAPTYVIGDETTKDWRKTLLTVGDLLNMKEKAEQAIKDYDQKAAEAKEKLSGAVGQESAAVLWLVKKNFFIVDETQSSGAVLYGDLGMTQPNLVTEIPAETKASWNPVSLEKLAELTADHIFLVNSDKAGNAEILNSPIWKGIPAVKAGHVYEMESKGSWLYSGATANAMTIDAVLKILVK